MGIFNFLKRNNKEKNLKKGNRKKKEKYLEKNNRGTRHDSIEKANGYWFGERFAREEKEPFILYEFKNSEDAQKALLELSFIHLASDTNNLISDEILFFGFYQNEKNKFEAVVGGKNLDSDKFKKAKKSFTKNRGIEMRELEPEK